ncbi:MAG TPA: dihydroorotase [Chitinophagaceae bacterium]|nr:dihydroorotase [Chitinophagaceae bacterium]
MQLLIRKVRILAPGSPFQGKIRDILIMDGIIKQIGEAISDQGAQVIEAKGLYVSPGWMDVFAQFCDPGYEYREDLTSGSAAAAAGGYTAVMVIPDTLPCLQSRSEIEYIRKKASGQLVDIIPIGAVSRDLQGKALAEMYDMHQSGALAFSNGLNPIQPSGFLVKALQYIRAFDGVIIQIPEDRSISLNGLMNEGISSTRLGMPGKAAIAEELMVRRDLELARYAGSRIHFTGISTSGSVDLIREAKRQGIRVTASVTPYHLLLTDNLLENYDAHLKVTPPLRSLEDTMALRKALQEGVLDCIATHHLPQDKDSKAVEFEYAGEGMIGLETSFGILNQVLDQMPLEERVALLSVHPRQVFGLPVPQIAENEPANLTIFNPDTSWIFQKEDIHSRSSNTPFIGHSMTGKVKAVVNHGQCLIF